MLLVSAGLLVVITIGGWPRLEGPSVAIMTLLWAGLYVLFALLVSRWSRGILPVASASAIILAIFAAVAAPAWFARSKTGLSPPPLPDDLLGLLTILVIPVQLLLDHGRDGRLQPGVARRGGAAGRRRPAGRRGRARRSTRRPPPGMSRPAPPPTARDRR